MTSEFGELLRHARAYKGVTLREAERATRISRHYLLALEREEFDDLPALTYARGIVRRYAEYLGLDPVAVLAKFEDIHGQRSGGFRVVPAMKPLDVPSHWAPNFAIIAFMLVISAVIFAWTYSAYFAPSQSIATPTTASGVLVSTATASPTGTSVASASTPTSAPIVLAPTATPTSASVNTPAPTQAQPTSPPTTAPTSTPVPTPAATQPPAPTPTPASSTHNFTITVTHDLWVQVTVDGSAAFTGVMPNGTSKSFTGQQMTVTSGDAEFVVVSVDGKSRGVMGTTWDAVGTYP